MSDVEHTRIEIILRRIISDHRQSHGPGSTRVNEVDKACARQIMELMEDHRKQG